MVKECLASSTTRSKLPLLIDFEFETVTDADMLSERMKWESLAFDPFLTDTDALGSYLGKLFSATPAITGAFAKLKEATAAFEKTMVGSNHFNETSLGWVIDGLLRSDLLTEAKRKVLKDFQGSKVVLAEIADVLNMRMLSLEKWQWDTNGAPIEQRKLLNGRSRFFHDDELLQAILLRYIGVKWSVFLKKALGDFQSAPNVWKPASALLLPGEPQRRAYFLQVPLALPNDTVEAIRTEHFREEIFLEQLADKVDEKRGSYDDDGPQGGDTRRSSLQITQTLLHTLVTEIIIKKALGEDITIVRTDFAAFGPSLPHLTIATVLQVLEVSARWVEFFRRTLEAPVKFMQDGPAPTVQIRKRGTPPSSPLSDFMAEAVLFCLDLSFNHETSGARMYRMHDDIWIWGAEKNCATGWEVMTKFAEITGLSLSPEKTGSVKIPAVDGHSSQVPSTLPKGDITWGFLKLDPKTGQFLVDQAQVDRHVRELRLQLEACTTVIDYVQAWNVYGVRFFLNNIGKPANCFGAQHVLTMLRTFKGIQAQLFGSNGTPTDKTTGSGTGDITSTLLKMIRDRFGVDVPEGFLYLPIGMGGLDLKNPFVAIGLIQHSIKKNPYSVMNRFFKQERDDYERAKKHFETIVAPLLAKRSRKEINDDPYHGQPFMTFREFSRHREQTSAHLYRAYIELMQETVEMPVAESPAVERALDESGWEELTRYQQRVVELHADDIIPRFGGLNIVKQGWLPTGMVSMFRESRFQWKS